MNNNDELYHYGKKGMKWGVRRTPEQIRTDANNKQIRKLANTSKLGKSTSDAFNTASNLADDAARLAKPSKKVKAELSKMSDKELREKINRMNMEQQYANLNPSKVSRGASHAANALSVIGSLAAIGGSVAAMALAIKQIKG